MKGPTPVPTALKLLRGNPGHHPLPKDEPKPEAGAPECPKQLDAVARRKWLQLIPMLLKMRVLTKVDQDALAEYCENYSIKLMAQRQLRSHGWVQQAKTGYTYPSMYAAIRQRAADNCLKLQREFGLTPSSRSRLHMIGEPAKPESKWRKVVSP